MENEKIFELIEKMYIDLKGGQDDLKKEIGVIKEDVSILKVDVSSLKEDVSILKKDVRKTNITIENDINPKIGTLFDGYKQNSEQLARIESEVSKHEEVILRRIK